MPIGYVAAAATTAGAISNLVGGSGSSSPTNQSYGGNPGAYIPTAQPQADTLYQGVFNQLQPYASQLPGEVIPGYQAYASNIQNNPYAGGALTGAQNIANTGQTLSGTQFGYAGQLANLGNQVATTAFDPQSALYNQLQNQTTQQAAAANATSGVQGPYAAGTIDQSLQNFNIGWQNQQLARQVQGEQTAGQAYAGASTLGTAGLGSLSTTYNVPYSTYLSQQQGDLGALSSLTGGYSAAFGPDQSLANLLQSYLGLGQTATGLAQAGQQQGFNQDQVIGNQLGQGLSGLKGIGSDLSNLFSSSVPDPGSQYLGTLGGYTPSYSTDQLANQIGFGGGGP